MTPIEQKMEDALSSWLASKYAMENKLTAIDEHGGYWKIFPQHKIGPYRVDFALVMEHAEDEANELVVIECDGHKWHNSTPLQVSYDRKRDRWFEAQGIPVLRFTGKDICTDAVTLANQAWQILITNAVATSMKKVSDALLLFGTDESRRIAEEVNAIWRQGEKEIRNEIALAILNSRISFSRNRSN